MAASNISFTHNVACYPYWVASVLATYPASRVSLVIDVADRGHPAQTRMDRRVPSSVMHVRHCETVNTEL